MARIKKADAPSFVRPEQIVEVKELGGDVLVRAPGLSERMTLVFNRDTLASGFKHLSPMLAVCVLDADEKPLFTATEWEDFGSQHLDAAMALYSVVYKLADFSGEEAAKNSKAPTSS